VTDEVAVKGNQFDGQIIEVAQGTTATWTWEGERAHNVTSDGWASDSQEEGSFQETFKSPGTYDYRCTLRGGMTGG
jgi:plastocyanin